MQWRQHSRRSMHAEEGGRGRLTGPCVCQTNYANGHEVIEHGGRWAGRQGGEARALMRTATTVLCCSLSGGHHETAGQGGTWLALPRMWCVRACFKDVRTRTACGVLLAFLPCTAGQALLQDA